MLVRKLRPAPVQVPKSGDQLGVASMIKRDQGEFRIGEDILHPNESNNHQVLQWQSALSDKLRGFCRVLGRRPRKGKPIELPALFLDDFKSLPSLILGLRAKLWRITYELKLEHRFTVELEGRQAEYKNVVSRALKARISNFMRGARQQVKDQVVLETQAAMTASGLAYMDLPAQLKVKFLYEDEPITFFVGDKVRHRAKLNEGLLIKGFENLRRSIDIFSDMLEQAMRLLDHQEGGN